MKKRHLLFALVMLNLMSGCVANQTLPYSYHASEYGAQKIISPVDLSVKDERSFILSGDKDPSYVGHFRGGYGNTWGVKTQGKIPLAEQFQGDVQKELEMLGASDPNSGVPKSLQITILDYNFDAYINGRFWYKFKVEVYGAQKNLLEQDVVEGEKAIPGSFWVGPIFAFKREIPMLHAQIIRSLVRENEKILKALQA